MSIRARCEDSPGTSLSLAILERKACPRGVFAFPSQIHPTVLRVRPPKFILQCFPSAFPSFSLMTRRSGSSGLRSFAKTMCGNSGNFGPNLFFAPSSGKQIATSERRPASASPLEQVPVDDAPDTEGMDPADGN